MTTAQKPAAGPTREPYIDEEHLYNKYQEMKVANERNLAEKFEALKQWKMTSELLEQERNRLTAELADVRKERDELLTAMAVVKQKFKADCELNEDTANLWLKVLNENTFLHQELDQALAQAAALAGALDDIGNAKGQTRDSSLYTCRNVAREALAAYNEAVGGRDE